MYQLILGLMVTALCVNSLTMYGSRNVNILVFNMSDREEEGNSNFSEPPPHSEVAKMARYIVHNSNWSVFAYKSQHPKTSEFPLGTILSVSDGPLGKGKGAPYMYVSEVEEAVQDTDKDSRCSLTVTLAQGDYCKQKNLDPQFPTCAQVTLIGRIDRVRNGTTEEAFAKEALFSRHPSMKTWPKDHHFFFTKLNIERVMLVDYFGGPVYVDVDDYFDKDEIHPEQDFTMLYNKSEKHSFPNFGTAEPSYILGEMMKEVVGEKKAVKKGHNEQKRTFFNI